MTRRLILAAVTLAFLVLTLASTSAFAQAVYGSILGTVTDPQGAAVPNAKVTVTNQRKGTSDQTTTNPDGNYSVTHLIPDVYTVRVEAPGFKTGEDEDLIVSVETGSRVDAKFRVGCNQEPVGVTATAPAENADPA